MIVTDIWDGSLADLSAGAKLVYLWSFTNPRCGMSGIYKCKRSRMQAEVGLCDEDLDAALSELDGVGYLRYDDERVFVIARTRHLLTQTIQIAKSIIGDLREMDADHPFRAEFIATYREFSWLRELLSEVQNRPSGDPREKPLIDRKNGEGRRPSVADAVVDVGTTTRLKGKKPRAREQKLGPRDVAGELAADFPHLVDLPAELELGPEWILTTAQTISGARSEVTAQAVTERLISRGVVNPTPAESAA